MHREELARLVRFSVTGVCVAAIYVIAYVLLTGAGMAPFWANLIAFTLAVAFQYVMQTRWTFRRRLADGLQGMRFVLTIGFGLVFSTVISTFVGPWLGWPPWVAAIIVAVTLPVTNYIVFRFWVYRVGRIAEDK